MYGFTFTNNAQPRCDTTSDNRPREAATHTRAMNDYPYANRSSVDRGYPDFNHNFPPATSSYLPLNAIPYTRPVNDYAYANNSKVVYNFPLATSGNRPLEATTRTRAMNDYTSVRMSNVGVRLKMMPPHGGSEAVGPPPPLSNTKATSSAPTTTKPPVPWKKLDKMILDYYEKVHLTKEEFLEAEAFVQNLEQEIRKTMPRARLEIGGSLLNGFGTHDSDVDLCFRLEKDNKPKTSFQGFDEMKTLREISGILFGMGIKSKIISAKVSIIKCYDDNSIGRPIDISCYNSLPLYNTKLLAKYCEWEPKRLPALGVWVKNWAKSCSIGDASEGTLSSYAWMIILIHYLQNLSPPVLPRLQEEFRTAPTPPEALHMKCDIYYHETVQENWSSNKKSVAELFVGFLKHLRNFDYENTVIQIRRRQVLTKREKEWQAKMCVEDPFLLTHNMAQRRGKEVINYIVETVKRSQRAFYSCEDFDAEKLLASSRLSRGLNTVNRCPFCDKRSTCKDDCENRYVRNPNWVSSEVRKKRAANRLAKKREKEKRPPQPRKQQIVNQVTDQFANLRMGQQNLDPFLHYPYVHPLMVPPPQGFAGPQDYPVLPPPLTRLIPPPLVGMPLGPPVMYPPTEFPPLVQEAAENPEWAKTKRGSRGGRGKSKDASAPPTGPIYNSKLHPQPLHQQNLPDFSNEEDFPSL